MGSTNKNPPQLIPAPLDKWYPQEPGQTAPFSAASIAVLWNTSPDTLVKIEIGLRDRHCMPTSFATILNMISDKSIVPPDLERALPCAVWALFNSTHPKPPAEEGASHDDSA